MESSGTYRSMEVTICRNGAREVVGQAGGPPVPWGICSQASSHPVPPAAIVSDTGSVPLTS